MLILNDDTTAKYLVVQTFEPIVMMLNEHSEDSEKLLEHSPIIIIYANFFYMSLFVTVNKFSNLRAHITVNFGILFVTL